MDNVYLKLKRLEVPSGNVWMQESYDTKGNYIVFDGFNENIVIVNDVNMPPIVSVIPRDTIVKDYQEVHHTDIDNVNDNVLEMYKTLLDVQAKLNTFNNGSKGLEDTNDILKAIAISQKPELIKDI